MKKKRRAPGSSPSALDNARAALERAGEDPSEVRTPEPSGSEETPAPVESASDAPETVEAFAPVDSAEAPESNAEASDDALTSGDAEASETAETPDSAETSDNAEASEASDDASTSDSAETPEASDDAPTSDNTETPDDAEASENAEASDASESADAAPTSDDAQASEEIAPQEPDAPSEPEADASLTETPDAAQVIEPLPEVPDAAQAVEPLPEEDAPETDDDEEDYGFLDEDDADSEEFAETERHSMMETKEITVGYHRAQPAKTEPPKEPKEPKEHKKKASFKTLNLDKVKDALRGHAEKESHEPQGNGDSPPSDSYRDAAIRKRVMQITDDDTRNYLLDRVLPQMKWYSYRSEQYRTMYYRLMAATILLGGLIPVFSAGGSYTIVKVILAFLGASVTAINAYIALHNYHDLWITYQKTREDLIHNLYCYFNGAGVFAQQKMSEKDLNVLLVDVCEDTLSRENGGWTTIVQKT